MSAPINLEARKTLNKYGALYAHVKYGKESKIISNEFCFRQMLKMLMAALHHFGYFSPLGICMAGIFGYGFFTLYILVTFWFNGLYRNLFSSFKMLVFHFIMMGNYIFAAANIERTSYEVFIVGFLNQLLNSLTILYLMTHLIVNLFIHLKNLRNKQEDDEYEELDKNVNLNDYTDMSIFKNDQLLDDLEEDKLEDDMIQTALMKNLGFNFNLNKNKLVKRYDSEPTRSTSMHPMSSHIKTLSPFDLVFNSLLLKSKLTYDPNPEHPPY